MMAFAYDYLSKHASNLKEKLIAATEQNDTNTENNDVSNDSNQVDEDLGPAEILEDQNDLGIGDDEAPVEKLPPLPPPRVEDPIWNETRCIRVFGNTYNLPQDKENFLKYIQSKLWFTYRRGFTPIGGTGPVSDTGWGCMLRCGQMMLAQVLSLLKLDDGWSWSEDSLERPDAYKKILHQLCDERRSCYSIHQIAQMGVQEGKEVGDWFGPNTIAQVIKKLSQFDTENFLAVHIAMDNTVCIEDIEKLCCVSDQTTSTTTDDDNVTTSTSSLWKPLFLVIPLRLGLSDINPMYFKQLKECLNWSQSVGIIGGKPNHAYYFMGCSDSDELIYLDPHTTQQYIRYQDIIGEDNGGIFDDSTYHCTNPHLMPFTQLDPSLAVGFFCATRQQFNDFCDKVKSCKQRSSSLFEVIQCMPQYFAVESRVITMKTHKESSKKKAGCSSKNTSGGPPDNLCITLDTDESEEEDENFEIP